MFRHVPPVQWHVALAIITTNIYIALHFFRTIILTQSLICRYPNTSLVFIVKHCKRTDIIHMARL